ncbi:hypothetical protein OsJ_23827 [Oryza sativa Japonica Group]|uniref:Uncharacterized protein n=3 Tax=Oryza TaxID=4527 RepID=Q69PV6_ORYSJ|nr:hypothetical protein OsJ_23827 [Oryza sativa Japonica Group]BAC84391.1 hypothetical protein [Oryza sativa Japonica Group]BAD31477.1 hypothetical protein [Oryza sativa Japonica Group]
MDNPNRGHEHAHQPSGQQTNVSSYTSPTDLVLGNHVNGSDWVNSSLSVFLEQHRLQLDRALQTHISLHNATLSAIVDSMITTALKEKDEEIARLHIMLNQLQELIINIE